MLPTPPSRKTALQSALDETITTGRFITAVLTDGDGLPLVSSGQGQMDELLAAAAPIIRRVVQRSNERAGFSAAQEIVVSNDDQTRMVCRFFDAAAQKFILISIVPGSITYRRAMNTAIRLIQKAWQ